MQHRRDIDGLRAVAILAVVGYHVGLGGVGGGFSGVDVFFVLSGFLITGILWRELDSSGRIDWWAFYARRARRLLPALAFTVVLAMSAGVVFLVPDPELRWLSQSSIAVAGFASNVFFWLKTGGYFGASAEAQPLLNTWSLAVEEQFYLVWPFVLVALWRLRRGRARARFAAVTLFAALMTLSFVAATVLSDRSAAFYLMPTRIWELATGAALALVTPRLRPASSGVATALGCAGLVAIAVPFVAAPSTNSFPGTGALPSVLGTAALLVAGHVSPRNRMSRMLASGPLVFIGQRSYSWYLLHWPALVFVRIVTIQHHVVRDVMVAGISLLLAHCLYHLLEQPLRTGTSVFTGSTRRALTTGAALVALMAGSGVLVLRDTYAASLLAVTESEVAALAENRTARDECPNLSTGGSEAVDCRFDPAVPVRLVLIGDSHAFALLPAMRQAADALGWGLDVMWDTGCPFVVGYQPVEGAAAFDEACVRENESNAAYLREHASSIGGVVTTSRASSFIGGDAPAEAADAWSAALVGTLASITDLGVPVVLVHDVPHFELPVPQCVIRKGASACGVGTQTAKADRQVVKAAEERAADRIGHPLTTWDPFDTLCGAEWCSATANGEVLYRDRTHLSRAGALSLASVLVATLKLAFGASA